MSKKHDENQDIRILSKRFKINEAQKTIGAVTNQLIGNKSWGRIDYLCHYCGYKLITNASVVVSKESYNNEDNKKELRNAKKASKQHQLTNKRK